MLCYWLYLNNQAFSLVNILLIEIKVFECRLRLNNNKKEKSNNINISNLYSIKLNYFIFSCFSQFFRSSKKRELKFCVNIKLKDVD